MGVKEVVSQQRWEEYVGGGKRGGLTTEMGGVCRWGQKRWSHNRDGRSMEVGANYFYTTRAVLFTFSTTQFYEADT